MSLPIVSADITTVKIPSVADSIVSAADQGTNSDRFGPLSKHTNTSLTRHRRWYEWYEPGTPAAEKGLLRKLDWSILLFTSMSFFIKNLDASNVINAYTSGMSDDLNLNYDQLNWFITYYNIGIIVGAPIVMIALTRIPPNITLSTCIAAASLLVLFIYKAQVVETIYAMRFFAGLFNAGVIPGSFYIIGSWYTKKEIARRSVLSMISFYAGSMFSGYLQTGLYNHMNGVLGLTAWRWLFIFDAVIGIPVAIFGFIFCPDTPQSRKPWWMTAHENEIAVTRIVEEGREERQAFKWPQTVFNMLRSWQLYCFPICFGMLLTTCGVLSTQWMLLYLRAVHPQEQAKNQAIATSVSGATILLVLISGTIADWLGNIPIVIFHIGVTMIFGFAVLAIFPAANSAFIMAAIILLGASFGSIFPLLTAWANLACGGDRFLRAFTTAMMVTLGYTFETLAQQRFFPVVDAPMFKRTNGYRWALGWAVTMVICTCVGIPMLELLFRKRRQKYLERSSPTVVENARAGGFLEDPKITS